VRGAVEGAPELTTQTIEAMADKIDADGGRKRALICNPKEFRTLATTCRNQKVELKRQAE
jgi:hypothetical protein